jgi:hypothetical protein
MIVGFVGAAGMKNESRNLKSVGSKEGLYVWHITLKMFDGCAELSAAL